MRIDGNIDFNAFKGFLKASSGVTNSLVDVLFQFLIKNYTNVKSIKNPDGTISFLCNINELDTEYVVSGQDVYARSDGYEEYLGRFEIPRNEPEPKPANSRVAKRTKKRGVKGETKAADAPSAGASKYVEGCDPLSQSCADVNPAVALANSAKPFSSSASQCRAERKKPEAPQPKVHAGVHDEDAKICRPATKKEEKVAKRLRKRSSAGTPAGQAPLNEQKPVILVKNGNDYEVDVPGDADSVASRQDKIVSEKPAAAEPAAEAHVAPEAAASATPDASESAEPANKEKAAVVSNDESAAAISSGEPSASGDGAGADAPEQIVPMSAASATEVSTAQGVTIDLIPPAVANIAAAGLSAFVPVVRNPDARHVSDIAGASAQAAFTSENAAIVAHSGDAMARIIVLAQRSEDGTGSAVAAPRVRESASANAVAISVEGNVSSHHNLVADEGSQILVQGQNGRSRIDSPHKLMALLGAVALKDEELSAEEIAQIQAATGMTTMPPPSMVASMISGSAVGEIKSERREVVAKTDLPHHAYEHGKNGGGKGQGEEESPEDDGSEFAGEGDTGELASPDDGLPEVLIA